jgi:hypothetical protein
MQSNVTDVSTSPPFDDDIVEEILNSAGRAIL